MSLIPSKSAQDWRYASPTRVATAVICGLAVGVECSHGSALPLTLLWGWDAAAAVYIAWLLATVFRLNSHQTARFAVAEDPDRFTVDILMVLASLASLIAVFMALMESGGTHGAAKTILFTTCVGSVFLSWLLVHTTFTLRYAGLFYDSPKGGVDFHSEEDPSFMDFAYLSFTVGMTFQVSDTDITKPAIRHSILRHALLSYVFGTIIVALTINLLAGLGGK